MLQVSLSCRPEHSGAFGSVRVTEIMRGVVVGSAVDQRRDTSVVTIFGRDNQLVVEVLGPRVVRGLHMAWRLFYSRVVQLTCFKFYLLLISRVVGCTRWLQNLEAVQPF